MKIEILIEKTNTGYSTYAVKYPVYTVSNSLGEIKANILEAFNLYFEEKGKAVASSDLSYN